MAGSRSEANEGSIFSDSVWPMARRMAQDRQPLSQEGSGETPLKRIAETLDSTMGLIELSGIGYIGINEQGRTVLTIIPDEEYQAMQNTAGDTQRDPERDVVNVANHTLSEILEKLNRRNESLREHLRLSDQIQFRLVLEVKRLPKESDKPKT